MSAAIEIRPFTPDDYPVIAMIGNACFPEYADTPEQLAHNDSIREPYIKWNNYIAEREGKAVAIASYSQQVSMYHPEKFGIDICILPEYQRRGIGSLLYHHLLKELELYSPLMIRGSAKDGWMGGAEFLTHHGFVEVMRDWESRLDLPAFDPTPYAYALERAEREGISIRPLAALASDLDRDYKHYEMDWEVTLDIPAPDTRTKPTFEYFKKRNLDSPDFLPEGWFIALDGEKYVGESAIWRSLVDNDLYVGTTGVLREYRRRGIAMALKIAATTFAKSQGADVLKTWNAQNNRAMLSINETLGFVKQPAWVSFEKWLREKPDSSFM
jgi:GNAT superfamily N-acetyltransferase